jgi:hypothetical protein
MDTAESVLVPEEDVSCISSIADFDMPNYFFHVRDDHGVLIEDRVGLNLPDLGFALDECRKTIQTVLREEEWQDILDADRRFEIVDRRGRVVLTVPFSEFESLTELSCH